MRTNRNLYCIIGSIDVFVSIFCQSCPTISFTRERLVDNTVLHEISLKHLSDGTEMLQMSKDYNVHIAVERSPLALRVEGLRASLKAMSKHIDVVKKVNFFYL